VSKRTEVARQTLEMPRLDDPLPTLANQLAELHQLGQCQAVYRRRLHRVLLWFLPVWLTQIVVILAYNGYKLFLEFNAPYNPDLLSPANQFGVDIVQALLALALLVLGMMDVHPLWGFRKRLYLMDDGLLYTNGKKAEVVRWDEIESIFWWKKRGISYLCRKDGSKFAYIGEMEKAREVSSIVAGIMLERLWPDVLARYQKAGKVHFGPLAITREGIANFSQTASWERPPLILWDTIEDVCFVNGKFGIRVSGKWKYWEKGIGNANLLPNPMVCVALVRHILQE
jgi:hypothetical protein